MLLKIEIKNKSFRSDSLNSYLNPDLQWSYDSRLHLLYRWIIITIKGLKEHNLYKPVESY